MKKLVLILLTLSITSLVNAQIKKTSQSEKFKNKLALDKKYKALIYKPEKEKFYFWDSSTTQWNIAKTTEFSYNSMGLIEQLISKDPNGVFMAKETNSYSGKNLTDHVVEQWVNNTWVNSYKVKIWYDSKSEPIKEELSSWNNNAWEIYFGFSTHKSFDQPTSTETVLDSMFDVSSYKLIHKTIRHFNSINLVDSETVYSVFGGTNIEPSYRNLFTYNSQELLDSMVQQMWDGFDWQNKRSTSSFEYDLEERVLSFKDNYWDGFSWNYVGKTEQTYLPYDGILSVEYLNDFGTLKNYKKYESHNDSLYNQILVKYENWDSTQWVSNLYEENSYEYDANGNILTNISRRKQFNGPLINNIKKEYINYIVLGTNQNKKLELTIYPNPTFHKINIKGLELNKLKEVQILDVNGKLLKTIQLGDSNEIDMMEFSKGIYFLKVDLSTYKIVKL